MFCVGLQLLYSYQVSDTVCRACANSFVILEVKHILLFGEHKSFTFFGSNIFNIF